MVDFDEPQVPANGPLRILNETDDWTGAAERLYYNGEYHLRKCFRIPLDSLHFNIENGRYHTKFLLLQQTNPTSNIDPAEKKWRDEIIKLLNGTWEDQHTGVNTRSDRSHFEQLVDDIRNRGQERPGIVLETGGVMSGNRRLAALFTLAAEKNGPRFEKFEAFIVPGHMDAADRWRLEMSAQVGQGRLLKEYDPVEKLLKMREGMRVFLEKNPQGGDAAALKAVATEFGASPELVQQDLSSLQSIEEWLNATGHPSQWWRANNLTEVFTEMPPLEESFQRNETPYIDRAKIKSAVFQLISAKKADYRMIRQIRTAVGPRKRRGKLNQGVPTAIQILVENAPSYEELKVDPTTDTVQRMEETAQQFSAEVEAKKEQITPLVKAKTAESNLESLVEILKTGYEPGENKKSLKKSLDRSKSIASEAIGLLE